MDDKKYKVRRVIYSEAYDFGIKLDSCQEVWDTPVGIIHSSIAKAAAYHALAIERRRDVAWAEVSEDGTSTSWTDKQPQATPLSFAEAERIADAEREARDREIEEMIEEQKRDILFEEWEDTVSTASFDYGSISWRVKPACQVIIEEV